MTVFNWLQLFGVPALITSIVTGAFGWILATLKSQNLKTKSLELGVQALLRDRLIDRYKYAVKEGYIDNDDLDSWENMYLRYHNLGANGVMDSVRTKILALPNVKE